MAQPCRHNHAMLDCFLFLFRSGLQYNRQYGCVDQARSRIKSYIWRGSLRTLLHHIGGSSVRTDFICTSFVHVYRVYTCTECTEGTCRDASHKWCTNKPRWRINITWQCSFTPSQQSAPRKRLSWPSLNISLYHSTAKYYVPTYISHLCSHQCEHHNQSFTSVNKRPSSQNDSPCINRLSSNSPVWTDDTHLNHIYSPMWTDGSHLYHMYSPVWTDGSHLTMYSLMWTDGSHLSYIYSPMWTDGSHLSHIYSPMWTYGSHLSHIYSPMWTEQGIAWCLRSCGRVRSGGDPRLQMPALDRWSVRCS